MKSKLNLAALGFDDILLRGSHRKLPETKNNDILYLFKLSTASCAFECYSNQKHCGSMIRFALPTFMCNFAIKYGGTQSDCRCFRSWTALSSVCSVLDKKRIHLPFQTLSFPSILPKRVWRALSFDWRGPALVVCAHERPARN